MKQLINDVKAFHEVLDMPISSIPSLNIPEERIRLRSNLILEEYCELMNGIEEKNLVKIADGMADTIYVIIGAALEFGINLVPVWEEVQKTNMAKAGGLLREDGKRLKPEGWEPPNIKAVLIKQGANEEEL